MRRGAMSARARRGRGAQGAVQSAVAGVYQTRPELGAHAGVHAAWWARNADTMFLISDHEVDPVRAQAARADAVTSQRLAEAFADAHTARTVDLSPVPASTAGLDLGPDLADLADGPDLGDVDALEVGL